MRCLMYLILVFLLMGCTSEEILMRENSDNLPSNGTRISLEDALKAVEPLFEGIDDVSTRSGSRSVSSVEYLGRCGKTRSHMTGSDTLFYLVNYSNNEGFAMLAADRRLESVYAISSEGSLSMQDTIVNPALKDFFETAFSQAQYIVDNTSAEIDPYLVIKNNIVYKAGPLLKEFVAMNWRPTEPFNKYCFTTNGDQAVAGCVAAAAEMCMTFNKWPESYKDRSFDWTRMFDSSYYSLDNHAFLMHEVGELVKMKYGVGESSSDPELLRNAMITMGFKDSGTFLQFNDQDVANHFKPTSEFRGPVFVGGYEGNGGHAWVADGVLKYETPGNSIDPIDGSKVNNTVTLIHCVWGRWGGDNGYFKWNSELNSFDENSYNTDYEERHGYKPPYTYMLYYKPFMPDK